MEQLDNISLEAVLPSGENRLLGALICLKPQDVIRPTQ